MQEVQFLLPAILGQLGEQFRHILVGDLAGTVVAIHADAGKQLGEPRLLLTYHPGVDLRVADQRDAHALLPRDGIRVRPGTDLFQGAQLQVLGLIDDDDLVCALQLLTDGQCQLQLAPGLRHLQRPSQHLQQVPQGSGAGRRLDVDAGRGVFPHKPLGSLGLADSRVPVDDDHALLQLAVADELIHILRNGGGNVVLGGAVGQGFLGVDLLLLLGAEELLQLALQGRDVAVVIHTAAVLAQCRLADPHEWGGLGLTDVLFLQELLHPCLQCAVVFLTHTRLLHFVSLRFGSSYPDPGRQPPPSAMVPHQAAAAPIPSGMRRGRSGQPCSRGRLP